MILRTLVITLLSSIGLAASALAESYREPDLDKKIFARDDLKIDKISAASLMGGLLSVANDYDESRGVNYELRGHALTIAARLKPSSKKLLDIMTQLKNKGTTAGDEHAKKNRTVGRIYRGVKALTKNQDHPANKICVQYCVNIALRLDDSSKDAQKLKALQQTLGDPDWNDLLKKPSYPSPWTGLQERLFKSRKQSTKANSEHKFEPEAVTLSSLLQIKTSDGLRDIASLKVSAKASPTDDSETLMLTIPQDVDSATRDQLIKARQLLKNRHQKDKSLPGGWEIKLTFGDSDQAAKFSGRSSGAAMALALESLLTGKAPDSSFALAGGIDDRTGSITCIGNALAYIEKAREAGFSRIVLPRSNRKILQDVLVSGGLDAVLGFELYTPSKFEGLFELVTGATDQSPAFSEFATLLKEKGLPYLKTDAAQEALTAILKAQPNHGTARFLKKLAEQETPRKTLSVSSSYYSIEKCVAGLRSKIREIALETGYEKGENDLAEAEETLAALKTLKPKIHPKINAYFGSVTTAIKAYTSYLKSEENPKTEEVTEAVTQAFETAHDSHNELMDIEAIRKQLAD